MRKAKVYLVGAGPGDPGLITVKGKECIETAEVVIYDYLAAPALLNYAPQDADIIYVGKKGGHHTLSQDEINALIVEKAKAGFRVCRLKGGDPFIFGRGGEEAEVLVAKDIPFEVVPGVTSAVAAAAYAGIPLTHRKLTATLAFVTGHEDPHKESSSIDWESLGRGIGTLVFFMGVKNLPDITQKLIAHGKSPDTPVALIRWGTTPGQQTVTGTLDDIAERVKKAGLKAPAIIVVGDVVQLRENLKWFETRPLLGKRIVVTRAREQASDLVKQLADLGAECLEYPTIKVIPAADTDPLTDAIGSLCTYDWIVFTSVNGVKFFFERLFALGLDVRALNHLHTAAIGPVTSQRLRTFGLNSDILPKNYRAEAVVEAFRKEDLKGKKVLLPRAAEARPVLPVELRKMGAEVDEVTAYLTENVSDNADLLIDQLTNKRIDLITFTSSSTVKNFKALLPSESIKDLLDGVAIASIGPITTDTAKELGFEVHITAHTYTIAGLCDAILKHYTK
ncbi:Uroporphyrinogen-III methyltransferase (EC / Uroporphyrinogen-III synthase (EC [Olavius sp. associated proteobacterium Delta 1]|nr:Uroporphyrinogen-III methyltransferase (EC / Uroporphyrinogen-III synthase (EC [Olavius sp. associated proteobacterium Delta 1]